MIKQKADKYFMKGDQLYRMSFQGKVLRSLGSNEAEEVLREIHAGDCGGHSGGRRLLEQLVSMEYFWPTLENDSMEFVRCCEACQKLGNLIHAPVVEMGSFTSP